MTSWEIVISGSKRDVEASKDGIIMNIIFVATLKSISDVGVLSHKYAY